MQVVCEQCGMPCRSTSSGDPCDPAKAPRCCCCGWPIPNASLEDIDAGWPDDDSDRRPEDLRSILLEATEPAEMALNEPDIEILDVEEEGPATVFDRAKSVPYFPARGSQEPLARPSRPGSADAIVSPAPTPDRRPRSLTWSPARRLSVGMMLTAFAAMLAWSQVRSARPQSSDRTQAQVPSHGNEPAFELLPEGEPTAVPPSAPELAVPAVNSNVDPAPAPPLTALNSKADTAPAPPLTALNSKADTAPAPPLVAPFDAANAMQGMADALRAAENCLAASTRFGTLGFAVTFEPSGQVGSAAVSGPSLSASRGASACFRRAVSAIRVPRFEGNSVVLKLSLPIGPTR